MRRRALLAASAASGGGGFTITMSSSTPAEIVADFYNYVIDKANGAAYYIFSDDEIVFVNRNGEDERIYEMWYTDGYFGYIEAALSNSYYIIIYQNGIIDFWD